jgi:hypothetical protein
VQAFLSGLHPFPLNPHGVPFPGLGVLLLKPTRVRDLEGAGTDLGGSLASLREFFLHGG